MSNKKFIEEILKENYRSANDPIDFAELKKISKRIIEEEQKATQNDHFFPIARQAEG